MKHDFVVRSWKQVYEVCVFERYFVLFGSLFGRCLYYLLTYLLTYLL